MTLAARPVGSEHPLAAIEAAGRGYFAGRRGRGLRHGVLRAEGALARPPRRICLAGAGLHPRALVQSNFGATADLVLARQPVGERILARAGGRAGSAQDQGLDHDGHRHRPALCPIGSSTG